MRARSSLPLISSLCLAYLVALPAQSQQRAYIGSHSSDTVFAIDLETQGTVPIPVGQTPTAIDVSQDQSTVYVTNFNDESVSVIDTATHQVVATIAVGFLPSDVLLHEATQRAYVLSRLGGTLTIVDMTTNTVIETADYGLGKNLTDFDISPDGSRVYISETTTKSIWVFDTATREVVSTVTYDYEPAGLALDPAGELLYVSNRDVEKLVIFDTSTLEHVDELTISTDRSNLEMAPDGQRLYVSGRLIGILDVIDIASLTVIDSKPFESLFSIDLGWDSNHLYAINSVQESLDVIDLATMEVVESFPIASPFVYGNFLQGSRALFEDDFESGNLSAWSSAAP